MSEQETDFLDEYANEEKDEAEVTGEQETPEADADAETTVEKGEEDTEASPATEAPKEEHVPLAALKAEREKRQQRDRELEDIRRQLAELKQPKQEQTQEQEADIWEDPDSFVQRRVQTVEQQLSQRLYMALEAAAREQYPDYDEKFDAVKEEAERNPAFRSQIMSAPNPALEAYKQGKRLLEFKQMQDPQAYRESLKAEIRAELERELAAKEADRRKTSQSLPPDLSASRSVTAEVPAPEDVFDNLFQG
jgi:hypothetical protein